MASSATSVGVKPRRAATMGLTWKLVAGTGDGVVDSVLCVHYTRNGLDGGLDPWAKLTEESRVVGEHLDHDVFRLVGQIADHVLQNLRELHIQRRFGLIDFVADVCYDLIDRAVTILLEADGKVAGVRLGDGGEAHLQASTSRGDLDFWSVVQNLLNMCENAVGLCKRGACRREVIEDKGASSISGSRSEPSAL